MKNIEERWAADKNPIRIQTKGKKPEPAKKGLFHDTMERLGIGKYNHNHDHLGRFTFSSGRGGGGASAGGGQAGSAPKGEKKPAGAGGAGSGSESPAAAKEPEKAGGATRNEHKTMDELKAEHKVKGGSADDVLSADLQASSGKKVTAQEAKEMKDSVMTYTGVAYKEIRMAQTRPDGDTNPMLKPYKKHADDIEKYIELSPKYEGTLYRGMSVSESTHKANFANIKPGAEISMKGLSSWTSSKAVSDEFGSPGQGEKGVVFKLPKSTKAASITHISAMGKQEAECLLSSKSKLVVSKIETITIKNARGGTSKVQQITLKEVA